MTTAAPAGDTTRPATARAGFPWTDASLVVMAGIWGANFAVMKLGAAQFPPLAFNALRILLGTLVLLAMALRHHGPWPSRAAMRRLALYGVIGNGLYQLSFVEALIRTSIANIAIMIASTPIWLALLGHAMGTERLTSRAWAGIALSFVGIALVLRGGAGGPAGLHSWTGDGLAAAGVACWVTYTMLMRRHTLSTDPIPLHAITLVGGVVPLLLVASPEIARVAWASVSVGGWIALGYGAIMAIVVAYLLWYRGVRLIGPTRTAMYGNLQPIVALVVAALMLGEVPSAAQSVGCVTTVLGLLLTRS